MVTIIITQYQYPFNNVQIVFWPRPTRQQALKYPIPAQGGSDTKGLLLLGYQVNIPEPGCGQALCLLVAMQAHSGTSARAPGRVLFSSYPRAKW